MSQAIHACNPSRRVLLARSGAALAVAAVASPVAARAAPAADADAELVAACQAFVDINAEEQRYFKGDLEIEDDDERSVALEPLNERRADLLDKIVALRAKTPTGFLMLVEALLSWAPDLADDTNSPFAEDALRSAILRDAAVLRSLAPPHLAFRAVRSAAAGRPEREFPENWRELRDAHENPAPGEFGLCQVGGPCPCPDPCTYFRRATESGLKDAAPVDAVRIRRCLDAMPSSPIATA